MSHTYWAFVSFQSTHPHGVRPGNSVLVSSRYARFNPRTHTGCDLPICCVSLQPKRFQSTHPHGVRLQLVFHALRHRQFQSTHPHGVRLKDFANWLTDKAVSIHAPTRGATCLYLRFIIRIISFNPRTHTGCDLVILLSCRRGESFQSTHPHGVRQQPKKTPCCLSVFQSTHPHGVRPATRKNSAALLLFQSTHPHGVRRGG